MQRMRFIFVIASLATAACSSGAGPRPGFSFLDPGVRAGQEQACAEAVAQLRGVSRGDIATIRTSVDPANGAVVMAYAGNTSGYCRVSADFRVLSVIF
jgi:hypothetical protein